MFHMPRLKIVFLLLTILVTLGIAIFALMYFVNRQSEQFFLEFTQNFQNIAMPVVTCVSVVLLYHSIKENTQQTKIARLDELISGHLDNLDKFMSCDVPDIPYVVKFVLSDTGEKVDLESTWDVKRLIMQVNAYLSIMPHVTLSRTRAAIYDYLYSDCLICGAILSSELQVEMEDLISLLKQRSLLENDANKNLYVWKKMNGITPVLNYLELLDKAILNDLSSLKFKARPEDQMDFKQPLYNHAQSISDFIDRVSKYEVLDVVDMRELQSKNEVEKKVREINIANANSIS